MWKYFEGASSATPISFGENNETMRVVHFHRFLGRVALLTTEQDSLGSADMKQTTNTDLHCPF